MNLRTASSPSSPSEISPPVHVPIDARIRISALWAGMLFVFAYVDLFSLYRPDVRADLDEGKVFVFDVSQTFLLFTTLFIIIPSLMVYFSLVLRPAINRWLNLVVAGIYVVICLGSAVGEWTYYVLGSVIEALMLAKVVHIAWTSLNETPDINLTAAASNPAAAQL